MKSHKCAGPARWPHRLMLAVTMLTAGHALHAEPISQSFELRYVTRDGAGNGPNGFIGGANALFDTDQRLEYLRHYAAYAQQFFNDPALDKKVVSLDQAQQRLRRIKPQPTPSVRQRIVFSDLKACGHKAGKVEAVERRHRYYVNLPGAAIADGSLHIEPDRRVALDFPQQDWRMRIEWEMRVKPDWTFRISIGDAAVIDSQQINVEPGWAKIKAELDLASQRYNLYLNGTLVKDFVPFENNTRSVSQLAVVSDAPLQIDNLYGIGFAKDYKDGKKDLHSRDVPFLIDTFIDDTFEVPPSIAGWPEPDYDDSKWDTVELPHAHGGERYKQETLYLRKKVVIPESERVELNAECLDPSGEIWVNGRPVFIAHNRHPISVDITRHVDFGEENLIAVKVDPYKVRETMRHTSSDEHIGWFAGRMHVDCTSDVYVKDLFAVTQTTDNPATITATVTIKKTHTPVSREREIKRTQVSDGQVRLTLYKWFPVESDEPVAQVSRPVKFRKAKEDEFVFTMKVDDADLWTPQSPNLYKLRAEILDSKGRIKDDLVITTGIRTVSQEGGTFRINGEPAMMNGALLFGMRAPIDIIARWQRSAPGQYIIKDLMQLKAMNANTARMSHHHGPWLSINDPRYAEYGDQLGVMFQWATTAWVRTASPWQLDLEGLPKYVRQVRNHPSVVMWQPANHPKFLDFEESMEWFEKVYDAIRQADTSRLIAPTSSLGRMGRLRSDDGRLAPDGTPDAPPVWTAPMLTRGSMEWIIGYGRDWTRLENWPHVDADESEQNWSMGDFRNDYLNSKHRAFFDFESEESIGQPNWALRQGKPGYKVMSYEWRYDQGSIGVYLEPEQWRLSQAWQAFSGFEAYKKKRWLDYDGMTWCPLKGGGNTGTYQKPLIDYYDHAKLGFYAIGMAFQPVLACSRNVDLVYGPDDLKSLPLVIMNLDHAKRVNLTVTVKTLSGQTVFAEEFTGVTLKKGRSFTDLNLAIGPELEPGYYAFEYTVTAD